MLVYPQMIQSGNTFDYPALSPSNAIAQKCIWLAMPALFQKDSGQSLPNLFGGATITSGGLQVPNNSTAGVTWPAAPWGRINSSGRFSFAWFGTPISFSYEGQFVNVPTVAELWRSEFRFERWRDTPYVQGRWSPNSQGYVFPGENSGQGDHLIAGSAVAYVVTYDGSTVKVYRNGSQVYNYSVSLAPNLQAGRYISICNRSPEDARNGIQASNVTLLAFFDQALTQSEVSSLGSNPGQILI